MFAHNALRPLWPVILFTPWLLLGAAYLAEAVHRRGSKVVTAQADVRKRARHSRYLGVTVMMVALVSVASTHIAVADPAADVARSCAAASPEEARSLADVLYEQGDYQRAGACYDAAGDPLRAQRAFLKAVGPNSEVTAHGVSQDGNTAKALFTQVGQAFHRGR